MGGDTDHEPPVENPRLLDPEEGLDGPGEAVLVPQLGHQRARHLVMVMVMLMMVVVVVVLMMVIKVISHARPISLLIMVMTTCAG